MRAYEFPTQMTKTGKLTIPTRLRKRLPANREVKVILLVPDDDDDEDKEWSRMVAEQFFKDDDPADADYDKL